MTVGYGERDGCVVARSGMAKSSTQERRAAWLREFEVSGLSLAEFCRREGLAYSTVLNWRRLAREAASASLSPDFVVVEALPPEPEPEPHVSPGMNECGERSAPAGNPERCGGYGMRDTDMGREAGAVFQTGAVPPLRVELLLPGGMMLRIFGVAQDRGGGGGESAAGCQAQDFRKGGAP